MKIEEKSPTKCPKCEAMNSMLYIEGYWYCPFCLNDCDDSETKEIKLILKNKKAKDLENRKKREEAIRKRKEEEKIKRAKEKERIKKEKREKFYSYVKSLYYFVAIGNIESILRLGIISRIEVLQRKIPFVDMSNPEVQKRRRDVHDRIPLYFRPKNHTTYKMIEKKQEKAIIIVINPNIIENESKEFCFSDGNMARNDAEDYTNLDDIDILDWELLKKEIYDYNDMTIKGKLCSEFLVYPKIDIKYFKKIITKTESIKNKLKEIMTKLDINIKIEVDSGMFTFKQFP